MVQNNQSVKCIKCSAIDQYEDVWKDTINIRRCKECGHQKILGIITPSGVTNEALKSVMGALPQNDVF